MAGQFEWYELRLQPGGLLDSQPHEPGTREHLTVVSGSMEVSAGDARQKLKASETARYPADCSHHLRNTGKTAASAWLVVMHPS